MTQPSNFLWFHQTRFQTQPVTSPLNPVAVAKRPQALSYGLTRLKPSLLSRQRSQNHPLPKPSSVPQEQGDLPDLTSLEMIAADPATACHGGPIEQNIAGVGQAESGGPQDRRVEDSAVAPADDNGASYNDANRAAPAPSYRPAYELADAAHERLGRGTHPPVLNA